MTRADARTVERQGAGRRARPGAQAPDADALRRRLGWDFLDGDYHVVVDAQPGTLLYAAAWSRTPTTRRSIRSRRAQPGADITFPDAWLAPDATTLDGAHAHAFSDINDDNAANAGEDVGRTAAGDFKYPLQDFSAQVKGRVAAGCGSALCTWDSSMPGSWRANRQQNAVQAFYLVNTFHDHLADPDSIAFLPPFAFEQATGDAVQVNTDDGAATGANDLPNVLHANNSNFVTPPAGQAPRMQMYLFQSSPFSPHAEVNGGDDALVVWHEYTHGLTSRLITTADGDEALDDGQAAALSEGWSDWYALDFAVDRGLVVDDPDVIGDVDEGADVDSTSDLDPGGHLVRSQGIDCPVGAGSPAATTRAPRPRRRPPP